MPELLGAYFAEPDTAARAGLVSAIVERAEDNHEPVIEAIRHLELWAAPAERFGTLETGNRLAGVFELYYDLPEKYVPSRPAPLLIFIPDGTRLPQDAIRSLRSKWQDALADFIIVAPTKTPEPRYHASGVLAILFERAILETRRAFNTDTDRTYLYGHGPGGDAAWMLALTLPTPFAAAIVEDGYPPVPYPEPALPLLLPNMGGLPVLSFWIAPGESLDIERAAIVADHNRAAHHIAAELDSPFTGVELQSREADVPPALQSHVRELLGLKRRPAGARVQRWVRFAEPKSIGWLRLEELRTDEWRDDQLAIKTAKSEDFDSYAAGVIRAKLAYLAGEVKGQRITLESDRVHLARITFSPGKMDLSKPVTIVSNGRVRFEGLIKPDIPAMLEAAYHFFDFTRPVLAEKTLRIGTDRPE